MEYSIKASSIAKDDAAIEIKESLVKFGTTSKSEKDLPNPAEIFLGSLSACILKSVERFSSILNFEYEKAEISVNAIRLEKPPRLDEIQYELIIYSDDEKLNLDLLKKNIEKFGTIFNTVVASCEISGNVKRA